MEKENLESIFRRIKKLLAIAEDSRADPNEAAAAASQAEKIMRKFQIEQSDLIEVELRKGEDVSFGHYDVEPGLSFGTITPWINQLVVAVAKLNEVQAVSVDDKILGRMYRFRGYRPDVEVSKFSFRYILNAIKRGSKQRSVLTHEIPAYQAGFAYACMDSLRLALQEKQTERAAGSFGLVVVKKDAVAKHFGEVKYHNGQRHQNGREGFDKGQADGRKLDVLLRGVGHTSAPDRKAIR